MISLAWIGFCLVVSAAVVACVARLRRRGLQVRRRRLVTLELRGVKWDSVVVDRREVSRRRAR